MIFLDHGLVPGLDFGSEYLLDALLAVDYCLMLSNSFQLLVLGLDFDPNFLLALLSSALLVVQLVFDYC